MRNLLDKEAGRSPSPIQRQENRDRLLAYLYVAQYTLGARTY